MSGDHGNEFEPEASEPPELTDSVQPMAFSDRVRDSFDSMVNLTIKTTVVEPEGLNSTITTNINLLQGDITNTIAKTFLEEEKMKEVRVFHMEQVDKGQDIIKGNIEAVKSIIDLAKELTV